MWLSLCCAACDCWSAIHRLPVVVKDCSRCAVCASSRLWLGYNRPAVVVLGSIVVSAVKIRQQKKPHGMAWLATTYVYVRSNKLRIRRDSISAN